MAARVAAASRAKWDIKEKRDKGAQMGKRTIRYHVSRMFEIITYKMYIWREHRGKRLEKLLDLTKTIQTTKLNS